MTRRLPSGPAKGARWLWGRTPLWMRLVTGALILAAVGLTVTGIIGVTLFRQYLVEQSGQQLRTSAEAVADAHADKLLRPGLNCGALPNATATELITVTGPSVISSYCPATVNGGVTAYPAAPDALTLADAASSGEPITITDRGKLSLDWQVVVVPLQYRVPRLPGVPSNNTGSGAGSGQSGNQPPGSGGNGGSAADSDADLYLNGYVLVAANLNEIDESVSHLVDLDLGVDSIVGGALVMLGYAIVRTALRPLDHIEEAAEAISAGDLSQRVPGGHPGTEIGRLSRALNGMLGQIEAAFGARERSEGAARSSEQRMRQFIADASHELRTPLTSIRGFAELYRQGATPPERVPELLRRIEDEAVRMGLLVEDLLLLARLDQQRPLAQEPVHLPALAAAALAGARVRAPDRRICLEVEKSAEGDEPVVIGDEARLRQALDNLVDNALRHTPAEARITVRVRSDRTPVGREYLVEVADTGPGLSEEAAAHVFERFYRADPARARSRAGDGGSGLGLAIVAAIATAHGGRASVHSDYGHGALFRFALPAPELPAEV
ncbi:MAG TPA: HAMP domain-containing sensor histidine kinase [Actinocrinis sp.]|nr:HAMP domain-containing sensor histidine kinase [Actinocrinis sp.]